MIFYLIYKPLKYKDDGRDVVNWLDFVTIHMTFPAINVWASYQLYYSILITVTTMCDSSYIGAESSSYCINYSKAGDDRYVYYYNTLSAPSLIAFFILFVEMSVNLTYYKDCVFATITLLMFVGMYWANI